MPNDATTLLQGLRTGETTARAATDRALARISEREPLIAAWAHVDPEAPRAQADALDAGAARGPLHGLPIGIKDVLLTRDMPTGYNSALYRDQPLSTDAAAVALLRGAGAVVIGKTATVELASLGAPPPTRNPHALEHTPGGSSSGSAAAVADGHVRLALGTQTGGSIIRPASFCGVWALKPSWGLVPTEGAKPFAPSLDTVGWFASSARDLKLPLRLLAPSEDCAAPARLRIGVWRTEAWPQAERATHAALASAIALLQANGATVVDVELPCAGLVAAHRVIMIAEGARSFLREYRASPDQLHPRIAEMVRDGDHMPGATLRAAHDLAAQARAAFDQLAGEYDAILSPSTIGPAPRGLSATGDLVFNGLFTLLHVPVVNLPLHWTPEGLPVGLTLSAARYDDHRLIAVAEIIQEIARTSAHGGDD
ncbi:amidase [Sphingomonas sp.]|uniref:amidase n=1 Tax=Sphingomonas sp. TaxID=28214 RepID=UPI002D7F58D0|nr:amidase [Sphingomonas sp.]HEU0043443.1 amidase [Sphingomonas sp.]